jgi:hypothetical protein
VEQDASRQVGPDRGGELWVAQLPDEATDLIEDMTDPDDRRLGDRCVERHPVVLEPCSAKGPV